MITPALRRESTALLAATALAAGFAARAEQTAPQPRTPRFVTLTIENDFFAGFDRHYTNGFQAAFTAGIPERLRELPPWSWSSSPELVLAFGQRIFTPADTDRSIPDPKDRPYAGWLYVMGDIRTRSGPVVDHLTATLGVVGPSALGRQAQNNFHALLGRDRANGWDHQVGDRLAVTLGYERAWRAALAGRINGRLFDVTPRVGVTVGNVLAYASAGAVVRYGSELPSDLPASHISLGPPRDGYRGAAGAGWYVWGGADARAVARNVFIDGSGSNSIVDRRKSGFDLQAGAVLVWPAARLGFTVVQRSREFAGQGKPDRFGQLTMSFPY